MNKLLKYYRSFYVVFAVLMIASPLMADINSVTTSPTNKNVPLGRSVSVSLVWTIDVGIVFDVGPVTVISTSGEFRPAIGSPVLLGTVPTTLSRRVNPPASITFSETVLVPESVIYQARKLGNSSLVYQRTFTDGISPDTGGIRLDITGSSGAEFSINRISLRFDDDSPVRLIPQKEKFRAYADITFSGSGLIKAVWEIADPSSTSGRPVYRTLRIVRQQLIDSRRVALPSPELPTNMIGIHLVRLRITDPETAFDTPNIRYFVSNKKPDTPEPPAPVGLLAPTPGAQLTPETSFGWQAMSGARAYQLELYAKQGTSVSSQPVTGMLVPSKQQETPLSPMALKHLEPELIYLWRVIAIGENGATIGISTLREIRSP
jgi:hypothetical protein